MTVDVGQQLYASTDLRRWTFLSETGLTSECPDLFPLPIENEGETARLNSLAGRDYVLGAFDGEQFAARTDRRPVDGGIDFYAAQSWDNEPTGRRIWIAWLNNWKHARLWPDFGARGFLTIPRELALRRLGDGGLHLVQRPVIELESVRGSPMVPERPTGPSARLGVSGDSLEVEAVLSPAGGDRCSVSLGAGQHKTRVGLDGAAYSVFLNRTRSGSPLLNDRHETALITRRDLVRLRMFIDQDSAEAFFNEGEAALIGLVPTAPEAAALGVRKKGSGTFTVGCPTPFSGSPWSRSADSEPCPELGWFTETGRSRVESLVVWPLAP